MHNSSLRLMHANQHMQCFKSFMRVCCCGLPTMSGKRRRRDKGPPTSALVADLASREYGRMQEEIWKLMQEKPDVIPRLHAVAMSPDFQCAPNAKRAEVKASGEHFHATLVKLSGIPKRWATEVMREILPSDMNSIALDHQFRICRDFAMRLFWFLMACLPMFSWPSTAHHKQGLKVLVSKRIRSMNRWQDVKFPCNGGPLNFSCSGCYSLLPADEKTKTRIKHISGPEVAEQSK